MSAATETVSRAVQWALRSNARCDQKWLNSGLQVRGWGPPCGLEGVGFPSLPSAGSSEGALWY